MGIPCSFLEIEMELSILSMNVSAQQAITGAKKVAKELIASKQDISAKKVVLMSSALICTKGVGVLTCLENGYYFIRDTKYPHMRMDTHALKGSGFYMDACNYAIYLLGIYTTDTMDALIKRYKVIIDDEF